MKNRQYLKNSILLCGESNGTKFKRQFTIVKRINEGSVAVCYEAYHEGSGRGILKEFYPQDISLLALERTPQGQLVLSKDVESLHEQFYKAKQEYIEPYETLLFAKQHGTDRDLDTFIPAFEIYHGCDDEGNIIGTVYIWTPEPELETFDKICDEIHKHPSINPEHKLVTVLSAIESLTKCICALHRAEMLHRDIKPSNFGFLKRGNETLTQTLSLFDINSICSVYSKSEAAMGTEGYWEPEAGYENANNQTDIYSIGATLFHAIIVSDEVKENKYLFKKENYAYLRELVDNSKLIQASEANSHPRLRKALTTILQKSLCERTYRYNNCEEMLEDIQTALYYALPSEIANKTKAGQRWVLADAENALDTNAEKNSTLTIKYHLYEHPLYACVSDNSSDINVLVIGFGNYGQKFLDACLQVGQMRGKTLNVTVVSDDETDKEIYLSERPALSKFFNVDGNDPREDSYGNVEFEIQKLERKNPKANASILQDIMCSHYDKKQPNYVFIALGDDNLNFVTAQACQNAVEILELNCSISYVCEGSRAEVVDEQNVYPVYVNADIKESSLYTEIERMAFNTHLVWEKNLNIDYSAIRAEFRKPYNHDSCVSSVLALKYKLFSIGIDLAQTSFEEAARLYKPLIIGKGNRDVKNELIWVEHRRWNTEKLCLGWQAIDNLEECASGITKDERRKRHICILRSKPEQILSTEYSVNGNFDKWDKASSSDLDKLDELERMSVELHRLYSKKAIVAKKQNLLSGNTIASIRTLIEGHKQSVVAFQEWFSCLKDIWNGDQSKVRMYKGLKKSFLNATKALPTDKKKSINEQVKAFEVMFYPIMASIEYRDWKQDDVAFIDNIPFVLTYTESVYMVIPYATSRTEAFDNVAAPTVVNPLRILYLYLAENSSDIEALLDSVPYTVEYMRKKLFKAAVEFVIAYTPSAGIVSEEDFSEKLRKLGNGRIRQIKLLPLSELEELPVSLEEYLTQRAIRKPIFALEKNKTKLSSMMKMTQLYKSFSNYEFDSANIKFTSLSGCDLFEYIRKSPYITVSDMAAFRLSSSESSNQPQFYGDYRILWDKYRENSSLWKQLCDILGEHSKKNDVIVSFKKKFQKEKATEATKHVYIIPFVCSKGVAKIIDYLKKHEILEAGSKITGYTTDSCEVIIKDRCGYKALYDKLFSNVYALMLPEAITPHLNTKSHEVNVVFDNLQVKDVQLSNNRVADQISLLEFFRDKGYIINLITSDGKVSFTYSTNQIKELLTTAGKMLEVYTYHKVKELGRFDDIVSSFEIDWEGTEVKNEFDCILTKGFRTLFIECKARTDIEQEFYFKLSSLADKFGINATAVLIADTQERSFYDNAPINAIQRQRGNMMNIVTVWKQDEIANIGHTLLKIINGNYNIEG